MQPKRFGNWGWYFRVLKWASENGLSLEVWGRLCDLVTPRSASIRAVAFMGPPAWRVSWPGGTACFSRVSSNSAWNRVGIGDAPADDPAAEDVENDVKIEVGPFRRSGQLRDIPRPDLIGAFGEQFGLGVDRVAQLVAALPNLVMVVQDAVQDADRAEVDALVEQGGVDLRRGEIGKARLAQLVEHGLSFFGRQRTGRAGTGRRFGRGRRGGAGGGGGGRPRGGVGGAGQPQGGAGGGRDAGRRRQGKDAVHQDLPALSLGSSAVPSRCATFLRNPHRGRGGISLLEDVAQRLGPPLEIGENALLVALLVVGGAGIGIVHPVTQGVIEEHRDLTGSGGDGLGLADTR